MFLRAASACFMNASRDSDSNTSRGSRKYLHVTVEGSTVKIKYPYVCGTVVFKHLFQNHLLGDYSEGGYSCFSDGKIVRVSWCKLQKGNCR